MTAPFSAAAHTGWALALFFALAALLKWKHRRMLVERRVNRGLRAYAGSRPADETIL